MSDERERSGYPNQPYGGGEPDRGGDRGGEGGMRDGGSRDGFERDPNGRDNHPQRQGFSDQDGGTHRGPRRSRYGRRRPPQEGGGDYQQHDNRPRPPQPEADLDDGDDFLPSFIAGPNGGAERAGHPAPHQGHGQGHGQNQNHQGQPNPGQHNQGHNPGHNQSHAPNHQPSQYGGSQHGGYQGQGGGNPGQQGHQGHQGHQGGQQPGFQGGGHAPPAHQEHHAPVPEEPSPEVVAAAAEFAEWEDKNPKLRGLLICNPTVKRGEPIVRGTRIPARILAAIATMGSSAEEMLRDYPALTKEGLDAALAFASAVPRAARS
jgi:uncharacterized protein (DUF433 family)